MTGGAAALSGILLLFSACLATGQDVCSPANRANNMDACLNAIRVRLQNKGEFWFGTQYATLCPGGPYQLFCTNPNFPEFQSMEMRVFPDGIDLTLIDKYLSVSFTSEAGSYNGCGHTFNMDAWQAEISPTSDIVEMPWHLRNTPDITWTASSDELYTLLCHDVGYHILHQVHVNIPGNDVMAGQIIDAYHGPKIASNLENPYAFFLFKQSDRVNITQEWIGKINSFSLTEQFSIPNFTASFNMTGPVAVNWFVARGDEYAAQYMESTQVQYTCPLFVSKQMDMTNRPILPNPARLTVGVNVDFVNLPITYSVCCEVTDLPRSEFSLNPYDDTVYNTALVRSANSPTITFKKAGPLFYPRPSFAGEMYTLITVDPDVPFAAAGTPDRPILHQMVVNIMDGDINTGNVTQTYSGPSPPDDNPHQYYFLLYKQEMTLDPSEMPTYAADTCSGGLVGRCLYNINKLVQDKNLTLVGANWLKATNDDYVIYRQLDTSDPDAVNSTCSGRQSYDDPCPTSTASAVFIPYTLLLLAAILGSRLRETI